MVQRIAMMAAVLGACLVGGCARYYYQVTDPLTHREYYTTRIDKAGGGAVQFQDARSGNQVTIQNSEIRQISEEEFNIGRYANRTPATRAN